jgi:hypothetical protein
MLVYTSLFFLTNAGHSIWKGSPVYTGTFMFLTCSSVMWHGTRITIWFWIDQAALLNIFIVSLLMMKYLSNFYRGINVATFLICVFLFWFEKKYFQNNIILDTYCHALIHLVGSLGQHIILYGLHFDIPSNILLNAAEKNQSFKRTISSRNSSCFFLEN